MKKVLFFAVLCMCCLLCACKKSGGSASSAQIQENANENGIISRGYYDLSDICDDETVLENPDKGWYIHYYDNGLRRYGAGLDPKYIKEKFPCLDHVYLRFAWSYLEEQEGQFNWELIDEQIEQWSAVGVRVAFRITCMESGGRDMRQYYATPKWVVDAGAKGNHLKQGWEPDYDDQVFLEKLENFHRAFAARYDNNPNVVYVDVGSMGVWGEGHTMYTTKVGWEADTVRKHCDIYLKYYQNTQLVITDELISYIQDYSSQKEMFDYLKERGVTMRDDSIGVGEQTIRYQNSIESPQYFYALNNTRPVILECEHFREMLRVNTWRDGSVLLGAIKQSGATYAGFHGYAEEFLFANSTVAKELANLMGYWLFVDDLFVTEYEDSLNIDLGITNRGAAVPYKKYELVFCLTDEKGTRNEYSFDSFDATKATPNSTKRYELRIDTSELAAGNYELGIRMTDSTGRPIYLALSSGDDAGYYKLTDFTIS
ncbi:MAG: DUF4832 domain-containing protein [Faecalimonas sp.]|nr:DUF4832 domain-containing protein [Faecalimonas sp.]